MKKILTSGIILICACLASCWYNHKWEDLHPNGQSSSPVSGGGCIDTAGIVMSYSLDVAPILQSNCSLNSAGCHKAISAGGDLTTYGGVSYLASLRMGDITWQTNPMPKGQSKLPDCTIGKIDKWIKQGYPNN